MCERKPKRLRVRVKISDQDQVQITDNNWDNKICNAKSLILRMGSFKPLVPARRSDLQQITRWDSIFAVGGMAYLIKVIFVLFLRMYT